MQNIIFKNQISFGQPSLVNRTFDGGSGRKNNFDDIGAEAHGRNYVEHLKASKS